MQVPEIFAPSVDQSAVPMTPATGPWVSPMRNSAPGLLTQTGDTLARTGAQASQLGNSIGDAIRSTVDGAQVKAAETQFLKSTQDVLSNPQTGYLYTRGMNAEAQWKPTAEAVSKARQDARATLTNPIQQRMFDLSTNDHMFAVGKQMADHQHAQITQYGIQQSQDHADTMIIQARDAYLGGRMDDYQKASDAAATDVLKVAELQSGAPPDSDIAKGMLRSKRTDLVQAITMDLLHNHQVDEAKQYLEHERDNIDTRAAETLGNLVKSEYDRNLTETKGDAFLAAAASSSQGSGGGVPYTYGPLATGSTINPMKITDVPGSPRPNGRTHDGYDIKMPMRTPVTAPLDGKVVKVWDDPEGGQSMRVQLADGNTLGIAHLSGVNLNEGDRVNRGQVIALSGKTGNATGPVLHVALMDPDGKYIDYFSASKPQPNRADIADPDVLDRAIDMAKSDGSLDPFQQRQVIRYMKSEHVNERVIQSQQYQDAKQRAVDWMAQNGNNYSAMPVNLKAPLRPSDAQGFQDMQDEEKLGRSDLDTQIKYWTMPPEQRTPAFVKDNYQNLKPGTFMSLLKNSTELQEKADNLPEAKVQDTMFRSALLENNFTNLLEPKSDADKQQLLRLRSNIDDVATSMQTALGRKLRPDEWQNVLNSQLKNTVFVERARTVPWAFLGKTALGALPGGGVQLPVTQDDLHYGQAAQLGNVSPADLGKTYVMSAGRKVYSADIPPGLRLQYELNRFKRGLPITEQGIADDWMHFGMPKQ